jgi:hypothetical protein
VPPASAVDEDGVVIGRFEGLELHRDAGIGGLERVDELLILGAVFLAPAPEGQVLRERRRGYHDGHQPKADPDEIVLCTYGSLSVETFSVFGWT